MPLAPPPEAAIRSAEYRSRRAELKVQVNRGEVLPSELLVEVELPDWLHGMPICQLLAAIHLVSERGACGLLDELRIPNAKPIGKMTYRQRRAVAAEVERLEGRGASRAPRPNRAVPRRKPRGGFASAGRMRDVSAGGGF